MNPNVRTYLIELARKKRDNVVYYSDLARDCNLGLNLDNPRDRNELSKTLGDVSAFEYGQGRPLVSSLVLYKQNNHHGGGFYNLAESLGIGKASALDKKDFGITEAAKSREFWLNEDNYQEYAALNGQSSVPTVSQSEFFTTESLEFFSQWQGTKYDSDNIVHKTAGAQIQSTVWETTLQLGKAITQNLPSFKVEGAKRFLQLGKPQSIKHYTWVKIFKDMDNIFFTIGIDAKERAFIYKIDCLDKEKSRLTTEQITMFRDLISESAKWNEIPYETLIQGYDFQSLTKLCVDFIKAHETEYDALIRIIAGDPVPTGIFKNTMLERSRPTGRDQLPTSDRNFKGSDTDFLEKSRQQKELGTCGEELVVQYETRMLKAKGLHEEAGQVRAAKDGEGYDVLSFDAHGIEKYIEVKTTTGGNETAFYLSENERAFMSKNLERYSIYRLYHFDADSNFAEFFEVRGDVESQLLMQPTQYRVFLRSNALEGGGDTKDNFCIATS